MCGGGGGGGGEVEGAELFGYKILRNFKKKKKKKNRKKVQLITVKPMKPETVAYLWDIGACLLYNYHPQEGVFKYIYS